MIDKTRKRRISVIITAIMASLTFLLNLSGRSDVTNAAGMPARYQNFEAPQVHPLALTPDGSKLLALNSADNRLAVFQLESGRPVLTAEIPVGLQPVSVAALNNNEAWVANWLSDSISIVDLAAKNVKQTIEVGDEPTDIAFLQGSAFVVVSEPREIKVFNTSALAARPRVIKVNGKKPRALSVDAANARVFVSIFDSANRTSIVPFKDVRAEGGPPPPNPSMSPSLPPPPRTGLIVKEFERGVWKDETGDARWSKYLPYSLPDVDLVIISDDGNRLKSTEVSGIGTHIGNSLFDAESNRLFVVNTDSHNEVRFEPNVSGRFISTRVSVLSLSERKITARVADLNPHINYDNRNGTERERQLSLGLPVDIVRAASGKLYVSAMSSARVGVLDADGNINGRIAVGAGPTGLELDGARARLYVLNRFENSISAIDTNNDNEIERVSLGFNPEPKEINEGRRFLYSGEFSAHGDISCASCHRDGHRDGLAWDLGDPRGQLITVETPNVTLPFFETRHVFHPLKGPMLTQTLKGIIGNEPLHWRGDKAGLEDFNGAFVSLLGGPRSLSTAEMAKFKAFVATLTFPPNPNENLDRTYPDPPAGASAERGRMIFGSGKIDQDILSCIDCHDTRQAGGFGPGTSNLIAPNFLLVGVEEGTDVNLDQDIKIPQLRGLYERYSFLDNGQIVSGFGFLNDGYRLRITAHLGNPRNFSFKTEQQIKDMEAYLMAFDTGTAPAVGLQVTANSSNKNSAAVIDRIKLLMEQADKKHCDLIVKGVINGQQRGFYYIGKGQFRTDRADETRIKWKKLLAAAADGSELTFTGVPVGDGLRMGIDRNNDKVLDGDER